MMDDIFMLDTFNTVYIWIGPESNEEEKKNAFEMVPYPFSPPLNPFILLFYRNYDIS